MGFAQKLRLFVPAPLRPRLAGLYHRWRARRSNVEAGKQVFLRSLQPASEEARILQKTSSRIHPNDGMFVGDVAHYFSVGLSAGRCVAEALAARPDQTAIENALVLPCGYGRELRVFLNTYPEIRFTACDIIREGVDFCVAEFGVEPYYSIYDLDSLVFGEKFDLIWCGSLITHLSASHIGKLIRLFRRSMAPGDLMIVTTAGEFSYERVGSEPELYGLTRDQIVRLRADYSQSGFGFSPYPEHDDPIETEMMERDYGISLTSPDWIRSKVTEIGGLREILFTHRGWDNHLDVFGFVKE
jgi:hypothetical protein